MNIEKNKNEWNRKQNSEKEKRITLSGYECGEKEFKPITDELKEFVARGVDIRARDVSREP
jgi:hypothetical protein